MRFRLKDAALIDLISLFIYFFKCVLQKEQRGGAEGEAASDCSAQHDGAEPAAVLHLAPVAQQVPDVRRARTHLQP